MCINCGFEVENFGDCKAIENKKTILSWTKEKRDRYEEKIVSFGLEIPFVQRMAKFGTGEYKRDREVYETEVKKEFGLIV